MKKWSLLLFLGLLGGNFLRAQDIFDPEVVHEVKINFAVEDWITPLKIMKTHGDGDRIPADVEVDGILYEGAGVRFKGNSSYNFILQAGLEKLPLNVKLNFSDKENKLPSGHKTLKLANGFRDPSFIREVLAYDIAREYMPASRAVFANVYANGKFLGLYTLVESVDNTFLDQYFGDHKGVLVKCDPNLLAEKKAGCPEGEQSSLLFLGQDSACYMPYYEMKSDDGWAALLKLIDVLHHDFSKIEDYLDVDQVLWMHAFNNYTVNLDSYLGAFCHNYYLYQDEDGVFHPIVWDMNLAFGGFRLPDLKTSLSDEAMKKASMFLHYKNNNEKRPLLTFMLRDDLYRKVYLAHMRTLMEEQGQDSLLYKRAEKWHAFIAPQVKADSNKLYSDDMFEASLTSTQAASQEKIIGIFDLMNGRNGYIQGHSIMQPTPPSIESAEHRLKDEKVVVEAKVDQAEQVWLCYRYQKGRKFDRIPMERLPSDEAGSGMIKWQADVPLLEGIQYYIIAEGQQAASLLPKRASFEFFTVEK